jgi:hypothetical protein
MATGHPPLPRLAALCGTEKGKASVVDGGSRKKLRGPQADALIERP